MERFWEKVAKAGPDDCWLWKPGATMKSGHGRFTLGRVEGKVMAHRYAYQLAIGPIPNGAVIRHTCDVPLCCNPRHLQPGSNADNSRDMVERGRSKVIRGNAKLTPEDIADIRRSPKRVRNTELAFYYDVSRSTISEIRNGKTWRVVGDDGFEPPTSCV